MGTAHTFRQAIATSLAKVANISEKTILSSLATPKATIQHQFSIPIPKLRLTQSSNETDTIKLCHDLAGKFKPNTCIEKVTPSGQFLQFDVRPLEYIKNTVQQVCQEKEKYGHKTVPEKEKETILIDYSSPNIAKPFHAGHLRSTLLGSFIKRAHDANGYKTVGINYLGDWGKQYGLLAVGFELFGSEEELEKDPIHHLYQVYVKINALAKEDPEIDRKANVYFKSMEEGDEAVLSQWRRFRQLSIESYKSIYQRLNISFDYYSGESETEPYISQVYDLLTKYTLVEKSAEEDGAWTVNLEDYGLGKPVVRRADGTSLYMTRDLANMLLRYHKFHEFQKIVFVVGSEQELYLQQLFQISQLIHQHDPTFPSHFYHANFGRIIGMSTRKGTVVFLQDILDTAKETMLENIKAGNQNKLEELGEDDNIDHVADTLGASAVIIQDMTARRVRNYQFTWDRMTAARGRTGVYLQYTYARMCGIERKASTCINKDADLTLLKEKEAFELAITISQLPDVIDTCCRTMDPCVLVQYLFNLSHSIGQANSVLRVKGVAKEIAEARLLLFWTAKTTLGNGLKILGIDPLNRM